MGLLPTGEDLDDEVGLGFGEVVEVVSDGAGDVAFGIGVEGV